METNTNLRISIPKPCHEDWNKFTPDEKGAFCKVCSKSVHDFTKKTVEEISTILIDEMSAGKKVCGRFNEDQLTPVPEVIPSLSPYALNFQRVKKFALALFLVFGGYLFSTPKTYAQKMGKVAYIPKPEPVRGEVSVRYTEPVKDTVVPKVDPVKLIQPKITKCTIMKGDVVVEPIERLQIMGGVRAVRVEEPVVPTTLIGQAVIEAPLPVTEVIKFIPPVEEDTIVVENTETLLMGLIAMPEDTADMIVIPLILSGNMQEDPGVEFAIKESTYVEVVSPDVSGAVEIRIPENALEINAPKLECYPNPSAGPVNIKYNVKENVQTSIVLFDIHGNLVKTLVAPQNMYAADYSSKFDISELEDGIYFCTMQSGDQTSTQRIILGR